MADLASSLAVLLAFGLHDPRVVVVFLALTCGLLAGGGFYRRRISLSVLDDLPALAVRVLTATAVVVCVQTVSFRAGEFDGRQTLLAGVVGAAMVPAGRAVAYAGIRLIRRRRWLARPALVLGAGEVGGRLASLLLEHRVYGMEPVGFLDADPLLVETDRPVPLLGSPTALAHVVVEFGIRDVIVAFSSLPEREMVDVIRTCDRLGVDVFFVPRLFELHPSNRHMDKIWGIPLVRMRRAAFRSLSWRCKRLFDVVVTALAIVALMPVFAACALAIRLEGGPGVLFRQERVGMDGRRFELLKFRSLRPASDEESATRWNIQHDDRLGPVGRLLRACSLDELPQLWNILRGDMSLVGPRPERPHFVNVFAATTPCYLARHRVPSGLTGWAQVHGLRGDTSIEERCRFDNYYIENWSLWTDLTIMLRTVSTVLTRAGG